MDTMDLGLLYVVVGGLLEPVWVITLQKYNETHSPLWGALTVVFMFLSPGVLAFAMETMPVGVAYSIWTGIGAVTTVIASRYLFDEKIDRVKVLFIFLIVAGVAGLEMSSEVQI